MRSPSATSSGLTVHMTTMFVLPFSDTLPPIDGLLCCDAGLERAPFRPPVAGLGEGGVRARSGAAHANPPSPAGRRGGQEAGRAGAVGRPRLPPGPRGG